MSETKLTPQEMYAISLCLGWTDALSAHGTEDAIHRREFATVAMNGLRRVYGEGYHAFLRDAAARAATTEGGATT